MSSWRVWETLSIINFWDFVFPCSQNFISFLLKCHSPSKKLFPLNTHKHIVLKLWGVLPQFWPIILCHILIPSSTEGGVPPRNRTYFILVGQSKLLCSWWSPFLRNSMLFLYCLSPGSCCKGANLLEKWQQPFWEDLVTFNLTAPKQVDEGEKKKFQSLNISNKVWLPSLRREKCFLSTSYGNEYGK